MTELEEIQKSIIGILVVNPESITEVFDILKPEHFPIVGLQKIFSGIRQLYNINASIDLLSIINITKDETLSEEDIFKALKICIGGSFTVTSLKNYVEILLKYYKSSMLKSIISRVSTSDVTIDEELADMTAQLEELQSSTQSSKLKPISEVFKEHKHKYFNPNYNPNFTYLGFSKLDEIIGGIEDTDLICIGARPAVGKSALALQIANNVSQYKKVAYFSLEMNDKQLLDRSVSSAGELSLSHVRTAKQFLSNEKHKFQDACCELESNNNLLISDGSCRTVSGIRNACKKIDKLGLIVIDYLQLLTPERRNNNRSVEVGEISKSLRQMALEMKVPIIVLSQLSRAKQFVSDKTPSLSDLRESGDIEQDCTVVMLAWCPDEKESSEKEIIVGKNRQGTIGNIKVKFVGEHMKFYELDTNGNVMYTQKATKKVGSLDELLPTNIDIEYSDNQVEFNLCEDTPFN